MDPRLVLNDQHVFQVRLFARGELVDEMRPARVQHDSERIFGLSGIRVHVSALRAVVETLRKRKSTRVTTRVRTAHRQRMTRREDGRARRRETMSLIDACPLKT